MEKAKFIVVLGGDGFMLRMLHELEHLQKPFYGINCGHKGALMNDIDGLTEDLIDKIESANAFQIHPLKMAVRSLTHEWEQKAWNEGCIYRSQYKALHFSVEFKKHFIYNRTFHELTGDGCIVATALGSYAYNACANGKKIPLRSRNMVWTPLHLDPRFGMSSILLEETEVIHIKSIGKEKHYPNLGCDVFNFPNIVEAKIELDTASSATLLHSSYK